VAYVHVPQSLPLLTPANGVLRYPDQRQVKGETYPLIGYLEKMIVM
jgi:hypothetical protein